MITSVNHITLAASDLTRSISFYRDVLGGDLRAEWASGAYLSLGSVWLCLELSADITPRGDDTHIAFTADDFDALVARVRAAAPLWKSNTSEGASLYFSDPDGHKLEIHDGDLESRLRHYAARADGKVTIYPPSDTR